MSLPIHKPTIIAIVSVIIVLTALFTIRWKRVAGPAKIFQTVTLYWMQDEQLYFKCAQTKVDMYVTEDTVLFKGQIYNIGYDPAAKLDSSFLVANRFGNIIEMHPETKKETGEEVLWFQDGGTTIVLSTKETCK
jgi:hypothetical protein